MNSLRQLFELKRIIDNFGNKTSKSLFSPTSKNNQLSQLARKIAAPGKPSDGDLPNESERPNLHPYPKSAKTAAPWISFSP